MNRDLKISFSVKRLFYAVASLLIIFLLLYWGRPVIVPLAFALLLAFILYPICTFLERKGISRIWSILWTIVGVVLLIGGIIFLFSSQIIHIIREFDDFKLRLHDVLSSITAFLNEKISILPEIKEDSLKELSRRWLSSQSGGLVSNTLNSTALFFTGLVLTVIYTFLLLLYRAGLKKAFVNFATENKRAAHAHMIDNVQRVGQQYLTGIFTLIVIIGMLNSLGLLFLGIDYPFFFGYLAAFLAIIPYVGTIMGGALPAVYAFFNYDSFWYPVGVVLIFWFIQILDGNFLTPRIVGGNLNINALAAIVALITGGLVWGIPGMILFLPYTAVLKVACEHYVELKPVSDILKDDLYQKHRRTTVKQSIKKVFKK